MLCPLCSKEAVDTKLSRGFERIISLVFICKVGNSVLWYCNSCNNYFRKMYKLNETVNITITEDT